MLHLVARPRLLLVVWLVGAPRDARRGRAAGHRTARADHHDAAGLVLHRGRLEGPRRQGGARLRAGRVRRRPLPRTSTAGDRPPARPACAVCTGGRSAAWSSCSRPTASPWRGSPSTPAPRDLGLRGVAIVLPMLAVTMSVGSVSFDDITLTWTLAGLPDVDRLESDLAGSRLRPCRAARRSMTGRATSLRFEACASATRHRHDDVLAGVDLELRAGTSTAIVGVNGAGKSTLVSLLSRLRDPTSGRDHRRRHRRAGLRSGRLATRGRDHAARAGALPGLGLRQHRLRCDRARATTVTGVEAAAATGRVRRGRRHGCPHGWETVLVAASCPAGSSSRAASGSAWRWPGRCSRPDTARGCWSSTSRPPPSTSAAKRSSTSGSSRSRAGLTTVVISHRFATVRRADVDLRARRRADHRARVARRAGGGRRHLRAACTAAGRRFGARRDRVDAAARFAGTNRRVAGGGSPTCSSSTASGPRPAG